MVGISLLSDSLHGKNNYNIGSIRKGGSSKDENRLKPLIECTYIYSTVYNHLLYITPAR